MPVFLRCKTHFSIKRYCLFWTERVCQLFLFLVKMQPKNGEMVFCWIHSSRHNSQWIQANGVPAAHYIRGIVYSFQVPWKLRWFVTWDKDKLQTLVAASVWILWKDHDPNVAASGVVAASGYVAAYGDVVVPQGRADSVAEAVNQLTRGVLTHAPGGLDDVETRMVLTWN